jgi:hypothetical protein
MSFIRLPAEILAAIEGLDHDEFVISAARRVNLQDIEAGDFAHLAISLDATGGVVLPERIVPGESSAPWARRNRTEGWAKKFTDLPKVTKTRSVESPNFGDWSKGSHSHTFSQEVYQKREFAPPGWTITMRELDVDQDAATIGFELDAVFDRSQLDQWELFFALNVFQEAIGLCQVRGSGTPLEHYRRNLHVNWELLPPGDADAVIREIERRLEPSKEERQVIAERFRVLSALKPAHLITGTSGFARYVGAQFAPDLVVFENIRYGNAAYIMFDDWQRLSQLSRIELLASDENFQRVIHSGDWERRLRRIVRGAQRRRRHH